MCLEGGTRAMSEAQAAEKLQSAARAWLAQRRVAAEVVRVRAELEEPGWELEGLLRAEAAEAGAARAAAEAATAAAAAEGAEAEAGTARRAAQAKVRKFAARAAGAGVAQESAEAAEEARLAAEVEAEAGLAVRAVVCVTLGAAR